MEPRPDLVRLNDQILYAPSGVYDLQCVARTTKGKRCSKFVEPSQTTGWTELRSKQGIITVYDMDDRDDATVTRWLSQHCDTHDKPDVVDFESPEWEPFDPTGAHAAMVRPLTDEWTR